MKHRRLPFNGARRPAFHVQSGNCAKTGPTRKFFEQSAVSWSVVELFDRRNTPSYARDQGDAAQRTRLERRARELREGAYPLLEKVDVHSSLEQAWQRHTADFIVPGCPARLTSNTHDACISNVFAGLLGRIFCSQ